MTIFEMVFNLIGLVLGLALVEVLSGLAKTFKSRPKERISSLTPLLGAWVLLDVSAFWGLAWEVRDLLTAVWPTLFVGVIIASLYYIAAALIFPEDIGNHPDLDAHYWATKRPVIGLVFLCDVAALTAVQLLGRPASGITIAINAVYFCLIAAAFFVRGRTSNVVILVALAATMTAGFLAPF